MHLTFWQPIPSFHQEGFLQTLAEAPWVESVCLKVETLLPESRKASGWREAEVRGVRLSVIGPDDKALPEENHVHVFTGFNTHRGVWRVFRQMPATRKSRCYAYAEAPECIGWKGWLRHLKYRVHSRQLHLRLDGILALGDLGVEFYRGVVPASLPVHRFAYYDVREADLPEIPDSVSPSGPCRLLYVGQLIYRKGVDHLLKALAPLAGQDWHLTVVGSGPEAEKLKGLAARLSLAPQIIWLESLPHAKLAEYYRDADVVVLPSRWDGWGMIVNEGLRHGCRVLATKTSGASCILDPEDRLPPDLNRWTERLCWHIRQGTQDAEKRRQQQTLARKLTGEAGLLDLHEILSANPR